MSHPAITSAVAKRILPEENQIIPGHAVGIKSHAKRAYSGMCPVRKVSDPEKHMQQHP